MNKKFKVLIIEPGRKRIYVNQNDQEAFFLTEAIDILIKLEKKGCAALELKALSNA